MPVCLPITHTHTHTPLCCLGGEGGRERVIEVKASDLKKTKTL